MILNSEDADRLRGLEERLARIESRLKVYLPAKDVDPDTESRFKQLVEKWETETIHLSSMSAMAMHPAYQEIIGMGPPVLPLLLKEMRDNPGHWGWALRAISGTDPVRESSRGKLQEVAAAWVAWGRERGLLS